MVEKRNSRASWVLPGLAVAAAVALPVLGSRAQETLKAGSPPIGQMLEIGAGETGTKFRMHLYCEGEGEPTVVFEAPLISSGLMWRHIQAEVARTTRACIYDRAGIGWSEASPRPRTAGAMVTELHDLLQQAGVSGPYILVSYSSGGLISRLYAHTYPEEVAGMVLADPSHEDQAQRLGAKGTPLLMNVFRFGPALVRSRIPALFSGLIPVPGGDRLSEQDRRAFRALIAADPRYAETVQAEMGRLEETFAELRSARITSLGDIPLVVLAHGKMGNAPGVRLSPQAEQAWQEMQREQAALSTAGRYIVVEDSGHEIPFTRPDLVISAIQEVATAVRQRAVETPESRNT
jgi:pimeloyl-ACP methyl ester carboxylesterase